MRQTEVMPGVTRVLLSATDADAFVPVSFRDGSSEYLRLESCVFSPRPVFRLSSGGSETVLQTANGEVLSFDGGR